MRQSSSCHDQGDGRDDIAFDAAYSSCHHLLLALFIAGVLVDVLSHIASVVVVVHRPSSFTATTSVDRQQPRCSPARRGKSHPATLFFFLLLLLLIFLLLVSPLLKQKQTFSYLILKKKTQKLCIDSGEAKLTTKIK